MVLYSVILSRFFLVANLDITKINKYIYIYIFFHILIWTGSYYFMDYPLYVYVLINWSWSGFTMNSLDLKIVWINQPIKKQSTIRYQLWLFILELWSYGASCSLLSLSVATLWTDLVFYISFISHWTVSFSYLTDCNKFIF